MGKSLKGREKGGGGWGRRKKKKLRIEWGDPPLQEGGVGWGKKKNHERKWKGTGEKGKERRQTPRASAKGTKARFIG